MGRPLATHSLTTCIALALVPLVAGACDDSLTDEDSGDATLSVFLKDAPGDVDRVWLEIEDVLLVGDGGQLSLLDGPTELIEVSELTESAAALVEDRVIDPGTYSQVRLVLSGAVLQAGESVYSFGEVEPPEELAATGSLQCPSCAQSGIKVKLADAFTLDEGENGFLLDFDLSQSFGHQAGQSGKWIMHPVVHGTVADPDDIEDGMSGGRIMGTVSVAETTLEVPACGGSERTLADFVPTATAATLVDDEGAPLLFMGATAPGASGFTFKINVSGPDTYALGYAAETVFDTEQLVWTATVSPESVPVGDDGVAGEAAYTVTAVSCTEVTPP